MIQGHLKPSHEEVKKLGRGTIEITKFLCKGDIGEDEFEISHTFRGDVLISIKGRTVKYSAEEMVRDALALIEEKGS